MGGIPFKSTGCNTCRRRKVKCDEAKPECMRCVKNGHVCTGYERQRTFIHKSAGENSNQKPTPEQQSQLQQPQPSQQRQQRQRQRQQQQQPQQQGQGSRDVAVARRTPAGPKNWPPGAGRIVVANNYNSPVNITLNIINNGATSVPRFDTRPEIRTQFLSSFIDNYLPPQHFMKDGSNLNMFQSLPSLMGNSPLLDKAIASLSSAFLAKQNNDDRLLQYSIRLYSSAMENLQGKIKQGKSLGKDLLYTTMIFQVYECIHCSPSGFPAWLAHVQGSNAIMRQCDDRSQESATEYVFLRQLRFVILCDAIGKRQAAWRYNIPLLPQGSPGSPIEPAPIDHFLDLLSELSGLLEQVDHLIEHEQGGPVSSRRRGERLLHACVAFEEKLHNACISMQAKLGIPSRLRQETHGHLLAEFRASIPQDFFPEPLWYPSLTCAESHMIYWTMLVLLYPIMEQLFNFLGPPPSTSGSSPATPPYQSIETGPEIEAQQTQQRQTGSSPSPSTSTSTSTPPSTIPLKPEDDFFALANVYATEVCRTVAYIVQPEMRSLGAQMLLAYLSQATQFFNIQEDFEKVAWCKAVFMLLPNVGIGIAPFLKDMVWPQHQVIKTRKSPTPPDQDEVSPPPPVSGSDETSSVSISAPVEAVVIPLD